MVITVVNDGVLEAEEVFSVQLASSDPRVTFDLNPTTVTILDNDSETLQQFAHALVDSHAYRMYAGWQSACLQYYNHVYT